MKQLKINIIGVISAVLGILIAAGSCLPVQAASIQGSGISTSTTLLRMNDAQLNARLNDITTLGAKWIRVDFSWPTIQPDGPEVFHWQMYDRVVAAAGAHHLKILAMVAYTPTWAEEPRCARLVITHAAAHKCNPRSTDEFAHFAAVTAQRYRSQSVRAWEIWNEPNLSSYWKTAQAGSTAVHYDAVAYARFANVAAEQIRYHDPDSIIITGGLAPMFESTYPKGLRQSDFLAQMLPHLHKDYFDGVGIHPYSWPALPERAATYNAYYTVDHGKMEYNLRKIMEHAGWGYKQVWATEFGASTKGLVSAAALVNPLARPDHVSEDMQAQIVRQGILDWRTKSNVGPIFVHSDSDQWLSKRKNEGGFGMRRQDGSKKPAYEAFRISAMGL